VTPEFSVVVPTRGDSGHLRAAVDTALRQRADLELLLVHDRRPGDAPLPLALTADPRARLFEVAPPGPATPAGSATPAGPSKARNAGLVAARGRYVAFLDDDDLWLPDHLETAKAAFAGDPEAALVGTDAYLFDDPTAAGSAPPPDVGRLPRFQPDRLPGRVSRRDLLRGNPFVTPAVILARDRLRPGERFDESLPAHEDYELWLRLARDRALLFVARPTVIVRRRRGSLSGGLRVMASTAIAVLEREMNEAHGPRGGDRAGANPPGDLPGPAERRRRLGRLWHELAYACLVEDDAGAARAALRQSIRRLPLLTKNYIYWGMSLLPRSLRRTAFRCAGGASAPSADAGKR
jgi:hypothetical protein